MWKCKKCGGEVLVNCRVTKEKRVYTFPGCIISYPIDEKFIEGSSWCECTECGAKVEELESFICREFFRKIEMIADWEE